MGSTCCAADQAACLGTLRKPHGKKVEKKKRDILTLIGCVSIRNTLFPGFRLLFVLLLGSHVNPWMLEKLIGF